MPLRTLALASASSAALLLVTSPASGSTGHTRRARPARPARAAACRDAGSRIGAVPRRATQAAVVCLVNQERRAHGLPALVESRRLNRSAQGWTDRMVATGDFSHGSDFVARIDAVGIRPATAGENIATGFPTPRQVVRGWMGSPGHCRNILDPGYTAVGTGVLPGPRPHGTWTEDFATPRGARARSANWGPADRVC
jgi:uncharacterized protein YkwD